LLGQHLRQARFEAGKDLLLFLQAKLLEFFFKLALGPLELVDGLVLFADRVFRFLILQRSAASRMCCSARSTFSWPGVGCC
jgi:hypothetical protein